MKIILLGAKGIMGGHVITAANKSGYEISSYVDVKCDPNALNDINGPFNGTAVKEGG